MMTKVDLETLTLCVGSSIVFVRVSGQVPMSLDKKACAFLLSRQWVFGRTFFSNLAFFELIWRANQT